MYFYSDINEFPLKKFLFFNLFLYLEQRLGKKIIKYLEQNREHLSLLLGYLEVDYSHQ